MQTLTRLGSFNTGTASAQLFTVLVDFPGEEDREFAAAIMARLDELRAKWDPDGVFHPWMGRL